MPVRGLTRSLRFRIGRARPIVVNTAVAGARDDAVRFENLEMVQGFTFKWSKAGPGFRLIDDPAPGRAAYRGTTERALTIGSQDEQDAARLARAVEKGL